MYSCQGIEAVLILFLHSLPIDSVTLILHLLVLSGIVTVRFARRGAGRGTHSYLVTTAADIKHNATKRNVISAVFISAVFHYDTTV